MSTWVHFNKRGEICRNKRTGNDPSLSLAATCGQPDCQGLQIKWIREDAAARMAATGPLSPALRLKAYVQANEIAQAEVELGMPGLANQISTAPNLGEDDRKSVLRFVAHSHYLETEGRKLADRFFPEQGDVPNRSADQIRDEVNRACTLDPLPVASEDAADLVRNANKNQGLQEFFHAGMEFLRKLSEECQRNANQATAALADHGWNMGAKGYSRWVYHFRQPEKVRLKVGLLKIFDLNINEDLLFGNVQMRWAAYPIEDGEPTYMEDGLKLGTEYLFVPRPGTQEVPFYGVLWRKEQTSLTVRVTKVKIAMAGA